MPEKFEGSNPNLVSILEGFVISLPAAVVSKAKLKLGQRYDVHFMRSRPFTLLFKESPLGIYTMSWQGKSGGGKLTLRKLYTDVLKGRVELPIHNILPIIMDDWDYDLGLMIENDFWTSLSSTSTALKELSDSEYGVYLCLDAEGRILRVGEGVLKQRLQAHLREQWIDMVEFRYFLITDENSKCKKEDGQLYEKILLRRYHDNNGDLPKYNKILR